MKIKSLNRLVLTSLIFAATACGDGYSNLSPSSNNSGKSDDAVTGSSGRGDSSYDSSPSRGGGSGSESGSALARGSNAWFAVESVEHALRLAVLSNADVAATVASTSSAISGQIANVDIALSTGVKLIYTCNMFDSSSRNGTVIKKDVSCSVAR